MRSDSALENEQPLRLLALYNPGGAEKALRELPDFAESDSPSWSVGA